MGKKSTTEEVKLEIPPDNLRCTRTDGRQWRCKRRAKENVKLCEAHYLQGKIRQNKEKVPESLKLQRNMKMKKRKKNDVVEIRSKNKKKKKNGDMQLELIRMVLQREVDKKKKMNNNNNNNTVEEFELQHYSEGELRKELPNGVMEIAPPSTSHDVDFHCNGKSILTPRYFRSKNVDRRVNFDHLQVGFSILTFFFKSVSYITFICCCVLMFCFLMLLCLFVFFKVLKKGKRKKCHWCQSSDSLNLIKCSNCQNEFFCMDCIKQRLELNLLC
jgi:lysine-specific demethylase 3